MSDIIMKLYFEDKCAAYLADSRISCHLTISSVYDEITETTDYVDYDTRSSIIAKLMDIAEDLNYD